MDGSEILAMPVSESALSDFEVGFSPLPESSRIYQAFLSSSRVSLGSTVSLFGAVGMVLVVSCPGSGRSTMMLS